MFVKDLIQQALSGKVVLTKFLDPSETEDLNQIKEPNLTIFFWGGYEEAERRRALIYIDDYANNDKENFSLVCYQIIYSREFLKISHRNILGTILSLGIKRETLGDIMVTEDKAYFLCIKEIASYLLQNFTTINHQTIDLKEIDPSILDKIVAKTAKDEVVVVESTRLDLIVAKLMKCSRSDSYQHIMTKNVFINHRVCENHHRSVNLGDMISIRKWGRAKVESVQETKKLRLRILFKIWR